VVGSPTCGLSSSNVSFTMNDGAVLYLNAAVDADRNGVVYGRGHIARRGFALRAATPVSMKDCSSAPFSPSKNSLPAGAPECNPWR
jgi:hypothetical protein